MPQRSNIVVNDGKATPVAHTFNPAQEGDWDLFEDKATGVAIGFPTISVRFRRPSGPSNGTSSDAKNRVYRIQTNMALPVLEVTSPTTATGIQPAPTVAYVLRYNLESILPERSTLADRKDLRAMFSNLLADSNYRKVIEDLEAFW